MKYSPRVKLLVGIVAAALVVGVGAGAWWYVAKNAVPAFPLNTADTISSWTFKGAYTGNSTLISQAAADTTKLKGLLGKGQYDDYDLYIGIGNDANLVGNGRTAYDAYNHSVAIHPQKGLAYIDLGHLFDEIGAYYTAADAYAKAVAVEPAVLTYHTERLTFLTRQFPKDTPRILAALKDASAQFGDTPAVLAIEAQWLSGQGKYANAIKAWEAVKMLSPTNRQTAIQTEIDRLKKKQAGQ